MTIRYCSDLHLEFTSNKDYLKRNPIVPGADVLILAGDIFPFGQIDKHHDFLDYVSENFGVTYWIPGNHEYYHFDLANRTGSFQMDIRKNVFLINNAVVILNEVKFIFSTLWTNISPRFQNIIQRSLNDFRLIRFKGERLTPDLYNKQHHDCLSFLKGELQKKTSYKTLVVTHHVPTLQNYPEVYKTSEINEAFAVEQFDLIESSKADYWIYGHHHHNTPAFAIGKTTLITNQVGYVDHSEHTSFNPAGQIEL